MGWSPKLGDQSTLCVSERRNNSQLLLLRSESRLQSSRVSIGSSVHRTLALFVDGRTQPVLGEDHISVVLCRMCASVDVAVRAFLWQSISCIINRRFFGVCSVCCRQSRRNCRRIRRYSAECFLFSGIGLLAVVV